MNEIVKKKKDLRIKLTERRNLIKRNTTLEFNIDAFCKLTEKIKFNAIDCVGSFMPIRSEISTHKLNKAILDMDKKLAFPTIEKNNKTLIFKTTSSDKSFKLGKFNIPEPTNDNKEIIPQLFFVPCLGFDLKGYRIGYGGGFYDKTFEKLKKLNLLFNTVGFAYDDQKQNELPIEKFDYKLDFVLTEKQLYTFL
ncbi:5-formyltetrahydrofolate cyclo-ligase [Pelagibacteraceae bacterium]|nr:5-formyltetrahydrofolate cyclo-ligase [Pelagibacteraceae bacterium]